MLTENCEWCGVSGRLHEIVDAGEAYQVCDSCHAELQGRKVFAISFPTIMKLSAAGRHDRALQLLNNLYSQHKEHDLSGWLFREVKKTHAHLLSAQRSPEGVEEYRALLRESTLCQFEYQLLSLFLAQLLVALDRQNEAAEVADKALENFSQDHMSVTSDLLLLGVELHGFLDTPIPLTYHHTCHEFAKILGITSVVANADANAILAMITTSTQLYRTAYERYQAFCSEFFMLGGINPEIARACVLAYLDHESVPFFRSLAQSLL